MSDAEGVAREGARSARMSRRRALPRGGDLSRDSRLGRELRSASSHKFAVAVCSARGDEGSDDAKRAQPFLATGSVSSWRQLTLGAVDRILFLAGVLISIIIDGVYLLASYLWAQFIDHLLSGWSRLTFTDAASVESWESALGAWSRLSLAFAPAVIVTGYLIRDVVGAIKRVWVRG